MSGAAGDILVTLTIIGFCPLLQSNFGYLELLVYRVNIDRSFWNSDSMRHISTKVDHD